MRPDPDGISHTLLIPGSRGRVITMTTDDGQQYSEHSHIPLISNENFQGLAVWWPPCASTGAQPTFQEKVVLLGGHVGLLDDEITAAQFLLMAPR